MAAQAKAAALLCGSSVEGFRSVIGTYLSNKQQNELRRLRSGAPPRRAEWRYSRPDTRTYNHLMHKLETLSRSVITSNPGDACQGSAFNGDDGFNAHIGVHSEEPLHTLVGCNHSRLHDSRRGNADS